MEHHYGHQKDWSVDIAGALVPVRVAGRDPDDCGKLIELDATFALETLEAADAKAATADAKVESSIVAFTNRPKSVQAVSSGFSRDAVTADGVMYQRAWMSVLCHRSAHGSRNTSSTT